MANRRSSFTASLFDRELPSKWMLVPAGYVLCGTQYGLSEPGATDGNIPIVGMKDIVGGTVNLSHLGTIDGDAGECAKFELRRGDILLNRTNSPDLVGKVGIVREDSNAVFASYLVRLHADRTRVDPEYLNFWLNSPIAQQALKRLSTRGVSQANINPTEFQKHCPVPLPPLSEQRQIAEIIRTWDQAIDTLGALRAAKDQRLDGLRAGLLFGSLSLEGTRSEWQRRRLSEVTFELSNRNTDLTLGREAVMGVTNSRGIVPMREQTVAADISRYKRLPPRAFAYNPMRINVGSIAMNEGETDILVSPDYVAFACEAGGLEPDYLDHLRKTLWWTHHITSGGSGSVRQRTYYDDLAALHLPLPEVDEQRRIVSVLDTARDDLTATEQMIGSLTRQKRGLMQKLLTGEWSVREIGEKEAAA